LDILKRVKAIPELRFLILCSSVEPNFDQQKEIKKMADISLNWDLIYDAAQEQRVLPLLRHNLGNIVPKKAPPLIEKKLKAFTLQNTSKNLFIFSFLTNLLSLFKKNNIDLIPFKGLISAQDIYGDIGLRAFSDIDILVKNKMAEKAWLLLIENGFKPELKLTAQQIKKYIGIEDNISFFNAKNKLTIELHWEMSGIYLQAPLLFENIERRVNKITIEGREFKNLSPEDLLIYLCIHGSKHGWEYLEQVCSVSELLKVKKELDWTLIQRLSAKWKCKNILLLGLNLARTLFNAPIPNEIYLKIIENKVIMELTETALSNMFNKHNILLSFSRADRFSTFHIRVKDNFFGKILYFLRLSFRPTKKEWIQFPIWAPLSYIHYLLRPIRLILTRLTKKNA